MTSSNNGIIASGIGVILVNSLSKIRSLAYAVTGYGEGGSSNFLFGNSSSLNSLVILLGYFPIGIRTAIIIGVALDLVDLIGLVEALSLEVGGVYVNSVVNLESVEEHLHSLSAGDVAVENFNISEVGEEAESSGIVLNIERPSGTAVYANEVAILIGLPAIAESLDEHLGEGSAGQVFIRLKLAVANAEENALVRGEADVSSIPSGSLNIIKRIAFSLELLSSGVAEHESGNDGSSLSTSKILVEAELSVRFAGDGAKVNVNLVCILEGSESIVISGESGDGEGSDYHYQSQNKAKHLFQGLHVVFPPYKNILLHKLICKRPLGEYTEHFFSFAREGGVRRNR